MCPGINAAAEVVEVGELVVREEACDVHTAYAVVADDEIGRAHV